MTWTEIPGSKIRMTSMAHMALELAMIKAGYGGEQPGGNHGSRLRSIEPSKACACAEEHTAPRTGAFEKAMLRSTESDQDA